MVETVRLDEKSSVLIDVTLGNSNKTFTVPDGEEWDLRNVLVHLTTSAVVGNRTLLCNVRDTTLAQLFARGVPAVQQAASLVRVYSFGPGLPADAGFALNSHINTPLPNIVIPPGNKIEVIDETAVDPTGDAIAVYISYQRRPL